MELPGFVMATKSRSTFMKRQKELARQQKQQDKLGRRVQRKKEREDRPVEGFGGDDPDIAGIVPGPQPLPDDEL